MEQAQADLSGLEQPTNDPSMGRFVASLVALDTEGLQEDPLLCVVVQSCAETGGLGGLGRVLDSESAVGRGKALAALDQKLSGGLAPGQYEVIEAPFRVSRLWVISYPQRPNAAGVSHYILENRESIPEDAEEILYLEDVSAERLGLRLRRELEARGISAVNPWDVYSAM